MDFDRKNHPVNFALFSLISCKFVQYLRKTVKILKKSFNESTINTE